MSSDSSGAAGSPWSAHEVELVVADYFAMLRAELLGEKYVKADHRRRLEPLLDGRSSKSVEWKCENVSAVLIELGYPYIDGYKPSALATSRPEPAGSPSSPSFARIRCRERAESPP